MNHAIILDRLYKLGVSDTELLWFRHYLTDRQQRVKFGDSYSDWGTVLSRIPQGSALGPLLFLIYVNDMPLQVKHGILVQFADDTCLICGGEDHKRLCKIYVCYTLGL